eukprot:scaffold118936_cov28-Tisochrysis_lutea.AAC.3
MAILSAFTKYTQPPSTLRSTDTFATNKGIRQSKETNKRIRQSKATKQRIRQFNTMAPQRLATPSPALCTDRSAGDGSSTALKTTNHSLMAPT